MKRELYFLVLLFLPIYGDTAQSRELQPFPLPAFHTSSPEDWLNSPPIDTNSLRGRVLLLDFWTFDCWNCYRSFPWLNGLEHRYRDRPFTVIGIHTPEFDHEKVRANLERKIAEYQLHHPIVMDNEHIYWKSLNNRYWPAFYLIDKQGKVRYFHAGETHEGDRNDRAISGEIDLLLGE